MTDDQTKNPLPADDTAPTGDSAEATPPARNTVTTLDADGQELDTGPGSSEEDPGLPFPSMDEGMFTQVQEMMARLEKADELERENAELRLKLSRLATDFEGYRTRTQQDVAEAQKQGVARAAEQLMPVYDDLDRAVTMGSGDPAKLIPGMQAVQSKVLGIFAALGLEATGREGEPFDPQWHEALQVVTGEQDDMIVQVYQLGFRMEGRLVRPARVVVSRRE